MRALPWFLLLLPLLSAVAITLGALRPERRGVAARLSVGAIAGAFLLTWFLGQNNVQDTASFTWLAVGGLRVDFGWRLDALSVPMLLVVTGVGGLIHVYSLEYMRGDRGFGRYFAGLSLFSFAMLGIILSTNLLETFLCWELVGLASYLLIGFWHERPAAADAGKKAFLTNRLGDFGFLVGILWVWSLLGTLNFAEMEALLQRDPGRLGGAATAVGLLIFCGVAGKSAQFPLHVWLPDAMEGPTPVSALIHAATMVAAGVYLLCRVFFLLDVPGSVALEVMVWIGLITALLAAVIAVQQDDLKRILAYSTLSQLGYMVLAVGLAGGTHNPAPAMYHLTTHAAFKALLFLGAGVVIHTLGHHEQDIWRMGGLAARMPVTFATFALATLALCGIPPLSGAYSKDAILALAAGDGRYGVVLLALLGTFLTSLYMFRLLFVAFLGPAKSQTVDHAHDGAGVMKWPLVLLALPTVLAGFWEIEDTYSRAFVADYTPGVVGWWNQMLAPFTHTPLVALGALAASLGGIWLAFRWYYDAVQDPLPALLGGLARAMRSGFGFDRLYAGLIAGTQDALARLLDAADRWVLAGALVRGTHGTVELAGRLLRLVQTGNLQTYALFFVAGAALLLVLLLTR